MVDNIKYGLGNVVSMTKDRVTIVFKDKEKCPKPVSFVSPIVFEKGIVKFVQKGIKLPLYAILEKLKQQLKGE